MKLSANAKTSLDKGDFAGHPNTDPAREVLFKSYSYEDGFLGVGCNPHAILEDKNGTIWIGANDRITAYHPEGVVGHLVVLCTMYLYYNRFRLYIIPLPFVLHDYVGFTSKVMVVPCPTAVCR